MRHVLVAQRLVLLPVAQVVVLFRQPQPTLVDHGNLFGRVFEVLHLAIAEEHPDAYALQLAGKLRKAQLAGVVDLVQ